MIYFVNAKINIGLQIVKRRADGYHDLQTLFYPVGLYAGTPENPEAFCDILEVKKLPANPAEIRLHMAGRQVDCPQEKNLVWRAARMFLDSVAQNRYGVEIWLYKQLPYGAGMGGGSADAAFTLRALADIQPVEEAKLYEMALELGADCPFFLLNRAAYAEGVGERLVEMPPALAGCWLVVVKPGVYVSTKEAFAGVTPRPAEFDLRRLFELPLEEWQPLAVNDFERSIFPKHPELAGIKDCLKAAGAAYASMTGSGSALYGIFRDRDAAEKCRQQIAPMPTISAIYLLKA